MDLYLITAVGKGGKSATIRALTGCRARGKITVAFADRQRVVDTWVEVRSLQENAISPKKAAEVLKSSGCPRGIVTLRIRRFNSQPEAQLYIDAFRKAGINIRGCAVIGAGSNELKLSKAVKLCQIESASNSTSANQRASVLRSCWGIV